MFSLKKSILRAANMSEGTFSHVAALNARYEKEKNYCTICKQRLPRSVKRTGYIR